MKKLNRILREVMYMIKKVAMLTIIFFILCIGIQSVYTTPQKVLIVR